MKKTALKIEVIEIEGRKQFSLEDNFAEFDQTDMVAILGFTSQILHSWQHIAGDKHNKTVLERAPKT